MAVSLYSFFFLYVLINAFYTAIVSVLSRYFRHSGNAKYVSLLRKRKYYIKYEDRESNITKIRKKRICTHVDELRYV